MSNLFNIRRACCLAFGLLMASACSVSERVKEAPGSQPSSSTQDLSRDELRAYNQLQYRMNRLDEARLGGQDILFVQQANDLSAQQQATLQQALQSGNLPLKLRTRIFARNPTREAVQLQQLDYQVMLDGQPLATGSTGASTPVEANTIITLPVAIDLNVAPKLTGGATPLSFAAGLANLTEGQQRLQLLIRPTYLSASGRSFQPGDFEPVALVGTKL
ncbi:hypothetical protein GCM10023185_44230 [Hymenobacter saemangeumensis]|uniref:DUF4840 domain-containing protein n=1 Tax=Hymenobacter saemangeumensis TaxID=1084522 RepID=A0ABP8IS67_9BACT